MQKMFHVKHFYVIGLKMERKKLSMIKNDKDITPSHSENVSRETFLRLKLYQELLETWQRKINLISSGSLPDIWARHFEDSLQLLDYLPSSRKTLVDMGSGAGFPGMVLAISCLETLDVTLIESDRKKCLFLENVSRETKTALKIINSRIEDSQEIQADIITARALAPLPLLFEYAFPFMKEASFCLFQKGRNVEMEIDMAKKNWEFTLEIFPSLTDSKARILKIMHLKRIPFHV
jgi:16S rRNA (guanine527-N7)-methyltransferase